MGNKALDTDRRDVRLQIFVTPGMDDKILDIAELMGMNKNEVCRMAIGQLALSYQTSIEMLKEMALGGKLELPNKEKK